jgi:hypothetical protein
MVMGLLERTYFSNEVGNIRKLEIIEKGGGLGIFSEGGTIPPVKGFL